MNILITGVSGMIGSNLAERLKDEGHYVIGTDIRYSDYTNPKVDIFLKQDLTNQSETRHLFDILPSIDQVFSMAAVMGGMEYLAAGECDYKVLNESTLINWNVLDNSIRTGVKKIFFSSSACVYPEFKQLTTTGVDLKESDCYPSYPDLEYGWQKLVSERIHQAAERTNDIQVRIARYHNIYGKWTQWENNKAKAPAALCRKVIQAQNNSSIDVIGDGLQTRSFTYIDDCVQGTLNLMNSNYSKPLNIGSSEMIAIDDLAKMIIGISGKNLSINHIDGPQGVRGRNSENTQCKKVLNWEPATKLEDGTRKLYNWVNSQINGTNSTSI